MKLQLYIYKSLRGFKGMREINATESVRKYIRDFRDALGCLTYNPDDKYLFYLVTYCPTGALFTILRTIPDKPQDHLASTIFVPAGMKISRQDMATAVHLTTRIVSNPTVSTEDMEALYEMFARDYPTDRNPVEVSPSAGSKYAFCYYGGDTDLQLDDFFGEDLFQPDFSDFAGVLLIDSDLGVTARGVDLTPVEEEIEEEPVPAPVPEPVKPAKPSAPKSASKPKALPKPTEEEGDDDVEVEYEEGYSFKWLLICTVSALIVGILIGWAIFHKSAPKIVAGEQAAAVAALEADRPNPVEQAQEYAREAEAVAEPASVVQAEPAATPTAQESAPAGENSSTDAISYLDNNKRWIKSDMEKIPDLKGLYDDMNGFKISRLTEYWGPKLKKSKSFARVAHHAAEGARKKVFVPQGTYNTPDDEVINLQTYLNRIDPAKN